MKPMTTPEAVRLLLATLEQWRAQLATGTPITQPMVSLLADDVEAMHDAAVVLADWLPS